MAGYRPKSLDELNSLYDKSLNAKNEIAKKATRFEIREDTQPAPETVIPQQPLQSPVHQEAAVEELSGLVGDFIKSFGAPVAIKKVRPSAVPPTAVRTVAPAKTFNAPAQEDASVTAVSEKPKLIRNSERNDLFENYKKVMDDEDDYEYSRHKKSRKRGKKLFEKRNAEKNHQQEDEITQTVEAEEKTEEASEAQLQPAQAVYDILVDDSAETQNEAQEDYGNIDAVIEKVLGRPLEASADEAEQELVEEAPEQEEETTQQPSYEAFEEAEELPEEVIEEAFEEAGEMVEEAAEEAAEEAVEETIEEAIEEAVEETGFEESLEEFYEQEAEEAEETIEEVIEEAVGGVAFEEVTEEETAQEAFEEATEEEVEEASEEIIEQASEEVYEEAYEEAAEEADEEAVQTPADNEEADASPDYELKAEEGFEDAEDFSEDSEFELDEVYAAAIKKRFIGKTVCLVLLFVVLVLATAVSGMKAFCGVNNDNIVFGSYRLYSAQSSYAPAGIQKGDLVVVKNETVKEGDVFAHKTNDGKYDFAKLDGILNEESVVADNDGLKSIVFKNSVRGVFYKTYPAIGTFAAAITKNYIYIIAELIAVAVILQILIIFAFRRKKEEDLMFEDVGVEAVKEDAAEYEALDNDFKYLIQEGEDEFDVYRQSEPEQEAYTAGSGELEGEYKYEPDEYVR